MYVRQSNPRSKTALAASFIRPKAITFEAQTQRVGSGAWGISYGGAEIPLMYPLSPRPHDAGTGESNWCSSAIFLEMSPKWLTLSLIIWSDPEYYCTTSSQTYLRRWHRASFDTAWHRAHFLTLKGDKRLEGKKEWGQRSVFPFCNVTRFDHGRKR